MTWSVNTIVFRCLLLTVALAPLPLGGNRPWAWSLLAAIVGVLAGAWSLLVLNGGARAPLPFRRLATAGTLFAVALSWAILQASPLFAVGMQHPLWREAAAALGGAPLDGVISAAPVATWEAVMRLACYGGVFLLAAQLATERARAHEALACVAGVGVVYAVYGLMVYFSGVEQILWLNKWAYLNDLTSTFINRNAYGAYAGLGVLCCLAMFVQKLRRRRNENRGAVEWTETLLIRAMPYLAAALVVGTALLLSHSRGAFLSTGAATAVLLAALVVGRVIPPVVAVRTGALIIVVGFVSLIFNGEKTLERLVVEADPQVVDDGRAEVYRLTVAAVADAPLTGHGLGAFQSAFRVYRDVSLSMVEDWRYAHSLFLETAMELGVPAALALFGATAAIAASCVRGLFRRRRDQVYAATAVAAVVLLGLHGLVDFSVQMPAVAMTLALLLGVGFAQSWSSRPSPADLADGTA